MIVFGLAVGMSYVYAFVGGFTDAANAIATSVGTRVLSPQAAVVMAGVFNLVGGLTGTAVALSLVTVVAALAGAMAWSLFTYFFGIPVSETHGLIGGLTPKYPLVTSYPAAAAAAGTYLQQALRCPAAKRPRPSNCVVS